MASYRYERQVLNRVRNANSPDFLRAAAFLAAGLDGNEDERRRAQKRNIDAIHQLREQLTDKERLQMALGEGCAYSHYAAGIDLEVNMIQKSSCFRGQLQRIVGSYIAYMERFGRFILQESKPDITVQNCRIML